MAEKIYVEEYGCNRRQLDVRTIRNYLQANGYQLVDRPEEADRILISTCAFKKKEEDESVSRLRNLKKYGKEVLVLGCLPDIATERYREFSDLPKIAPKEIEKIDEYFQGSAIPFAKVAEAHVIDRAGGNWGRTLKSMLRSSSLLDPAFWEQIRIAGGRRLAALVTGPKESFFLFICRGCDGRCSYCAIKRSVGSVRSKPPGEVLGEFHRGLGEGYREFNLLGDDPGCYGTDNGSTFPELLRLLLKEAQTACGRGGEEAQFHIKEMHPKYMIRYRDELQRLPGLASLRSVLCPVQSGSDRILGLMQREHRAADISAAMQGLRQAQPGIVLDTQIIVGFPSETEQDFRHTLSLVKESRFNSVVVFPYHDKSQTPAASLPDKLPEKVIRRRMREAFGFFRREGIRAYYSCP